MSRRLRSAITALLAVGVILFLFRNYYGGNGLLFGDANFLWSPSLLHAELVQFLHVWRPAASGGTAGAIANASQNYVLLQALFAPFGIPLSTVLVFPFLLCAGAFSFYLFARTLGSSTLGSVISTVFFLGNPWILDQMLAGHVAILAAVALSPLVFFAFLRLRRGDLAFGFLLLALYATELAFDPRISIFVFAGILIAGIIDFIKLRTVQPARGRLILGFSVLAPLFAVLCNGEWTILYALGPDPNLVPFFYPPVEDLSVFSWFGDIWHSLVMSAYFIHFSWTVADVWGPFTFVPWYAAAIGVLIIPLLGSPKRRLSFALALPAIVAGILLSMGTRALPPMPVYWVYSHIPLLSLLREPVKFGYLTMLGASVLVALSMRRLSVLWRVVLAAAVLVVVAPAFSGTLAVPEGYGFQDFAARPAYLRMLHFLERQQTRHNFRIAIFPPWLAEQSLTKGAFYTANPFVYQNEIPVLDAKLINTANKTSEQAWQAFYGIYAGTDTHPAATLAEFGVKYVVVPGDVHMSAAAALTPFSSSDDALNAAILSSERQFTLVYSDGQNQIFENRLFRPIFRTPKTPLIAGEISASLRQALPAATFGDAVTTGENAQALPPGSASIAESSIGRCIDEHGALPSWNAYYGVTKHDDWSGYWVASDWLVSAPDTYRSRIVQRFPLPFAYTESLSAIAVPLNAPRAGKLYVEAATIGSTAVLQARVDRRTVPALTVTSDRLQWFGLGSVTAGAHTVSITGSPAGAVVRRLVLDDGSCGATEAAARGKTYFVPGPVRWLTIDAGPQKTTIAFKRLQFGGTSDNPVAASVVTPPGAVAATWDYVPVTLGRAFPSFTGLHRLNFLAPVGQPLQGSWQRSDAAGKDRTLYGSRWPQRADIAITDAPRDQSTLIDLSIAGAVRGTRIFVGAPQGRMMIVDVDALRTSFLAIPYIGPAYTISLVTPANGKGKLTFGADVRAAVPIGNPQFYRIPSSAVASVSRSQRLAAAPIASYTMNSDGNLQASGIESLSVSVPAAQGLVLHVRGLRAGETGRAVLTAFYDSWAAPPPFKVADVAVGTTPANYDIAIPIAPFTEGIAFSLLPAGERPLALSLGAATLSDSDPLGGGVFARIPAMRVSGGEAVTADAKQIERIPFRNARGGYVAGAFTYDPQWRVDARPHWEINGSGNLWRAGSSGVMTYGLQSLYRALMVIGLALWVAALLAFIVLQMRSASARS